MKMHFHIRMHEGSLGNLTSQTDVLSTQLILRWALIEVRFLASPPKEGLAMIGLRILAPRWWPWLRYLLQKKCSPGNTILKIVFDLFRRRFSLQNVCLLVPLQKFFSTIFVQLHHLHCHHTSTEKLHDKKSYFARLGLWQEVTLVYALFVHFSLQQPV